MRKATQSPGEKIVKDITLETFENTEEFEGLDTLFFPGGLKPRHAQVSVVRVFEAGGWHPCLRRQLAELSA